MTWFLDIIWKHLHEDRGNVVAVVSVDLWVYLRNVNSLAYFSPPDVIVTGYHCHFSGRDVMTLIDLTFRYIREGGTGVI